MNKIVVIGILCFVIVGGLFLFNILSPEMTYSLETIEPTIICYGGGC
jgi:hypothetical protein